MRFMAILFAVAIAIATLSFTSGSAQSSGPPAGYDLAPFFSEEFSGTSLDKTRWSNVYAPRSLLDAHIEKRTLPANGEMQAYFDKAYLGAGIDPFRVSGGVLTMAARPLSSAVRAAVAKDVLRLPVAQRYDAYNKIAYSSGMISTRDAFAQKYGYFEIRARWSGGRGIWPAFWMLPADGSWPPEIDVMEAHGDKPGIVFQSLHSKVQKPVTREVRVVGDAGAYHRYGVLWLPGRLDFFVDGAKTATMPTTSDLTKPMYLVANLAIGGYWSGFPNQATTFPATMQIDYIRVWTFRTPPPGS